MTNDESIVEMIAAGRIRVDAVAGLVFAPKSNTPFKPVGAKTAKGYLRLCLSTEGRQRHFMVHRIVWVSVHGPLPDGWSIDHRNRTAKSDNRLVNLDAVPIRENTRRAQADGAFQNVGRRDGIRDSRGRFGHKHADARLLDGCARDGRTS